MTVGQMAAKRDALLDARSRAVRKVEFEGRRVSYAADAEMAAAIADLERRTDAERAGGGSSALWPARGSD